MAENQAAQGIAEWLGENWGRLIGWGGAIVGYAGGAYAVVKGRIIRTTNASRNDSEHTQQLADHESRLRRLEDDRVIVEGLRRDMRWVRESMIHANEKLDALIEARNK